ncbi:zinc-dependent alcohol dehydrogenase family protein [Paenibacillus piri]|uniref:Alcohol dehydrogenase n=1 Tax=Paenibacillus piri TaxID=2547395 RepID=A0A4R5KV75_9BACL|nr:zinc-dependent alcohol dehydrogenase family protein [Paenibacillus piri]TDF98857.1 alcohol dehydrogenase [Paenibacillus piri]
METFDAVRFYRFGQPADVLQLVRRRIREPGPGELRVRMTARPINPSDLIPIRGAYPHRTPLPAIPGYEGVGVVEAVGPFSPSSLLGKRVLPLRGEGTWQEQVIVSAELAVPVPDALDDEAASQLYINPVTAWICTETLRLEPGVTLLVNAGGSSIGRIFAQLAAILGFRLIAVTRHARHTRELLELGASHVIDTSDADTPSLREAVLAVTEGRGADSAIDSIGGGDGAELASCIRPGGTIVSIGLLSGVPVSWGEVAANCGIDARLFWLRQWIGSVPNHVWQDTFAKLLELIARQKLKLPGICRRYELAQFGQAVLDAETPGRQGKIILVNYS